VCRGEKILKTLLVEDGTSQVDGMGDVDNIAHKQPKNQLNSVTSKNIVVVDPLFDNPENSTISKPLIDLSFSSNVIDNPSSDDLLSNNLMSFHSPTTASLPPRLPSSLIFNLNIGSLIPPNSPVENNPKTNAEMLLDDLVVFIDPLSSVVSTGELGGINESMFKLNIRLDG
ncbi:unnamed protein product, partial [Didymodactylos carnosus]